MAPRPEPVQSDDTLPARADAVIIGGGIAGVATALELAERGLKVALCEKGIIAGEQSSRNWGWCRQTGRDPREIPLILESMELWRGMNERVGAETGYRQCGILYPCETDQELAIREKWFEDNAQPYQLDCHLISGEETDRRVPGATVKWKGGIFTPNDGRAEPTLAAPAMASAARKLGATIHQGCAVRALDTQAGRVCGVITENGPIASDTVVLAGGYWSRRFLGNAGIELPQLGVVNSVLRTEPIETPLTHNSSGGKFAFRKRLDGGYTIAHRHLSVADIVPDSFRLALKFLPALRMDWNGIRLRAGKRFFDEARLARRWSGDQASPFEAVRVLDPEPVEDILDEAVSSLKRYFPAFAGLKVAETWAGCIDAMPDAVPVISGVEAMPGLWLATGFSGHGFGLGPGAGKLMAEMITGERPCVDADPFRYSRYFDGTNPRPMAGL